MNKKIKLFFVSDGHGLIHSHALVKYLSKFNYDVDIFFWKKFFHKSIYSKNKNLSIYFILSKIENKIIFGPIILLINFIFILKAISNKYNVIFILRGTHINSLSILLIKKLTDTVFISYNNDDPFSKLAKSRLWKNYKSSIKYMDHCFVYRHKNIQEHLNLGCKNSSLLRSYFVPEFNYKIEKKNIPSKFVNDVIFAGHFENDDRDKVLLSLLKKGINLKIFGSEWERSIYYQDLIRLQGKIYELNQFDYNLALNGSKIALVFLSKINSDTYTRRCFEIPLSDCLILSEWSSDLETNVFPNGECEFFFSTSDLEKKIYFFLKNEIYRKKVIKKAINRVCERDSVYNRVETINEKILSLLS